ncbi:hypothetical protein FRC07_004151, partial [Ceratobasidium sp. 392]
MTSLSILVHNRSLEYLDHNLEHVAMTGPIEPLGHILAQASTLTNVTGSGMLLRQDIFDALGHLPLLERLEIWYSAARNTKEFPQPFEPVQASDGAFPALNQLVLRNVTDDDIDDIWRIQPLVGQLVSLEISFHHDITNLNFTWTRRDFISLICGNSPHITHLQIGFYEKFPHWDFIYWLTEEELQTISTLPLTRFSFLQTKLNFANNAKRLAMAWPGMEILECPAHQSTLGQLCLFAMYMPRLQCLKLEIEMVPLPLGFDLDQDPELNILLVELQRPDLRDIESRFSGIAEFTPENGLRLYRYLKTLWPHAYLTVCPDYQYAESKGLPSKSKGAQPSSVEETVKRKWKQYRSAGGL